MKSKTFKQLRFYPALIFVILILICPKLQAAPDRKNLARTHVPKFEKILTKNIVPFWYSKSLDHKNGGYILNFDINGQPKNSEGTKMIVTQARTMWLFSRLARAGYGGKECLDAADIGFRFLREKMWDDKNGGFYWEVDATGNKKLKPLKHLYGQSFALYALSEYYLASNKQEVLDFAIRFFNLLEAKSHDKIYGGYIEFFNEDWTPVSASQNSYMGTGPHLKLMNTHLHLLEAMTTFYRASELPLLRERLLELINIETNTVVRKN
ncbi:MAG: AGE family epimerase/isomerase, partial [Planctomycetota bacterium]